MRVAVMGIGNVLMGDEGVGVAVINELRKLKVRADIYDCGTTGIDILNIIADYDKVIVVDAVRGFGKPGDVVRIKPEELKSRRIISMHDLDFVSVISIAKSVMKLPEIVIIGIEVERVGEGLEISESVRRAIPRAIEEILKELEG